MRAKYRSCTTHGGSLDTSLIFGGACLGSEERVGRTMPTPGGERRPHLAAWGKVLAS